MLKNIKKILSQYFSNFYYFFRYLRFRIFFFLVMSVMKGILDGLGLAMFLPLLKMISSENADSADHNLGNLSFIINAFDAVGLEMTLFSILATMLFFFILKGVFNFLEGYLQINNQQFFIRRIRVSGITALSGYSYSSFVTANAGRIQNTLTGESARVALAYRSYMTVITNTVTIFIYSLLAFLANPEFALLVGVGAFLTNILFSTLYRKTKSLSEEVVNHSHSIQGLVIQQVAFFKYLKATGLSQKYAGRLIKKVYDMEDTQKKVGTIGALMTGVKEPILMAVVISVIIIQVSLFKGSLELILLSILFFYRALNNVLLLQTAWNLFLSYSASMVNFKKFEQELLTNSDRFGDKKFTGLSSEIELRNLNFSYPGTDLLTDINLKIKKNVTIAFVGESGSGKTTLLNLVCGLLRPSSGELLVDKVPISDLDIHSYSQKIGYITQEPVIFDDTVFNNVTFWDEKNEKNLQNFNMALKKANIFDFVYDLREKEDSRLGNNGINVSGGQKQRISIARELYKDIDILIMDEATSALDSETEKNIQLNIDSLKGHYTILIVAHRLSTIRNVDRIVFLKGGMIRKSGTYRELISEVPEFKRMAELQELG